MLEFKIFGITPIKALVSLVSDANLWEVLLGLLVIAFVLRFLHNLKVFHFVGFLLASAIVIVQVTIRGTWFVISQTYMMSMFYIDSKNKHYNTAEYWSSRKLTVEGIKAIDSTGTQKLLIKHCKVVEHIILWALIAKRVVGNIKYKVFAVTKH